MLILLQKPQIQAQKKVFKKKNLPVMSLNILNKKRNMINKG